MQLRSNSLLTARTSRRCLAAFAVLASNSLPAFAGWFSGEPVPPSHEVLRARISTASERVEYSSPEQSTVWARAHSYRASFDATGAAYVPFLGKQAPRNFPVHFALEAVTVGSSAIAFEGEVAATRSGDTVFYARGAVIERYDLEPRSMEQSFVFPELPRSGDLVISIGVESELAPRLGPDGIEFSNELGLVRYSFAVAIDARGQRIDAPTALTTSGIEIRVPASFLARASFPLTIDPVVSTFGVEFTTDDDFDPDVAYDLSNDRWLVVYEEIFSATDHDAVAELLTATGGSLGRVFVDSPLSGNWVRPRVANNNSASQFLVVAKADGLPRGRETSAAALSFGALMTLSTLVVGSGVDVGGDPFTTAPSHYLVAFDTFLTEIGSAIGKVLVHTNSTFDAETFHDITAAETNGRPSVSNSNGTQTWNVVWPRTLTASNHNVRGMRVQWDGVVTTAPFTVEGSATDETAPEASSPLDADSDRWCVVFARDVGVNRNIIAQLMDDSTVLDEIDMSSLDGSLPLGDQFDPAVDSDGQSFLVVYSEFQPGLTPDEGVFLTTLSDIASQLFVGETAVLSDSSSVEERRGRVTSKNSGGGTPGRSLAAWNVETGGTALGDVEGGLIETGDFTSFCHPGSQGVIACPCANPGAAGRGCANSANANGALLAAAGSVAADTVVLTSSGMLPTATCIFGQGNALANPSVAFGDGVRCAGGSLKRLFVKAAVSGTASAPGAGDPSLTVRSAQLGDTIAPGSPRFYYTYYRDPAAFACTATFNSTNSVKVQW